MGSGNFRTLILFISFIITVSPIYAIPQKLKTSEFLYNQLEYFLKKPSPSGLLRLSKLVVSKESHLYSKKDQLAWVIVHVNMGYYHWQYSTIPTAILYYEKAWKAYDFFKLSDYDIIENCLQPLGNLYIKIGDLQKAENTITSYLYLAEKSNNTKKIVAALTNLSIAYNNQSNYSKAIEVLMKGQKIAPNSINIINNLATNYLALDNIQLSQENASKAIRLDPTQVNSYQILAEIALKNNKPKIAHRHIIKAKSILLKKTETTARAIAKWQLAYVDVLLSTSRYSEAQIQLKEIYSLLIPNYNATIELPTPKLLIADKILLTTLDIQAYIYQQTNKSKQALVAYELSFLVNQKLAQLYPLQDTKILQHTQNRNRTEAYLDLLYRLHLEEPKKKYNIKAFKAAEATKAPFVNESLLSKQILSKYTDDPLVKKAIRLNAQLSRYESAILKEKQKGKNASIPNIQKWNNQHHQTSTTIKDVTESLQKNYPNLVYKKENISIEVLQNKLHLDNSTMISYFFGSKKIYEFQISEHSFEMKLLPFYNVIKKNIKAYINLFDNPAGITNDIDNFQKTSFRLYQSLQVPNDKKKLLIIPDGLLYFVPFESLLTNSSRTVNFQHMPFLLKSTKISYEISANKHLRSNTNSSSKKSVLGIFPVFENTSTAPALPFSLDEKRSIEKQFEGTYLQKENATYQQFLAESNNHTILHLSTHATSGSFSKPASIKFIDQDILVNQLYGLQLNADLAVLSACETGIGILAKGEGPLSIGRGFQYAGVKNTLLSLWKVNDKTTSQFMNYFYEELQKTNSYANAQYQAKLNYLDSGNISNAKKSPYYWSAFVYYGRIDPTVSPNYIWIYILPIIGLIILILLGIRFYKK